MLKLCKTNSRKFIQKYTYLNFEQINEETRLYIRDKLAFSYLKSKSQKNFITSETSSFTQRVDFNKIDLLQLYLTEAELSKQFPINKSLVSRKLQIVDGESVIRVDGDDDWLMKCTFPSVWVQTPVKTDDI